MENSLSSFPGLVWPKQVVPSCLVEGEDFWVLWLVFQPIITRWIMLTDRHNCVETTRFFGRIHDVVRHVCCTHVSCYSGSCAALFSTTGGVLSLCGRRPLWRSKIQASGDCEETWRRGIKTRPGKVRPGIHSNQCWKKEFEVLQLRRLRWSWMQ